MLSPRCEHEGAYAGPWVFTSAPVMEGRGVTCMMQSETEFTYVTVLPTRVNQGLIRLIEELGKEA